MISLTHIKETLLPLAAGLALLMLGLTTPCTANETPSDYELTLRIDPIQDENGKPIPVTKEQTQLTIPRIKETLKASGISKPTITEKGADTIIIKISATTLEKTTEIRTALETTGKLELKEVHPESDQLLTNNKTLAQSVFDDDEIRPGYRAYKYPTDNDDGSARYILVKRITAIHSDDISDASPSMQQEDSVEVTLNKTGTDKMIALTKNMRPGIDRIAILLDNKILSAPVVQSVPLGKNFIINGLDKDSEPKNLSLALMNPIENSITVTQIRPIPSNN